MNAYTGKVLYINLEDKSYHVEPLEVDYIKNYIGGRGFNMKRLYDMTDPDTDPLSPDNPLIFGVGPLNGTLFPGASRFNVSAKSPLTGIIGDSNAGGFFGPELKYAGFDQVIFLNKSNKPVYVFINNDIVEFKDAEHIWGKDIWETHSVILKELKDPRVQVACVGPAAENGVRFAGIFTNLVRAAARTGMGTVMASKNVKAVAVRGTNPVKVFDPKGFMGLIDHLNKDIFSHYEYEIRCWLGTTKLVTGLNDIGGMATRHFKTGRFEYAADVSGETLASTIKVKSKACFSCPIPCSRYYRITKGPYAGLASEGPEYEGLAGFSSRVGVKSLHASLKGVDICNRMGIDVISASECISFAMECFEKGIITSAEADGLDLNWGKEETVFELLRKIVNREGFGDILADGVRKAAQRIGRGSEEYAFHVKGLEIFQADPRAIKGYALGNAVASRGADHLRSEPSFEFTQDDEEGIRRYGAAESAYRLEYKGKGRLVKHYEELAALADSLNACKNTIVNMEVLDFDKAGRILTCATGENVSKSNLEQACERTVNLERMYLVREGISRKDDYLPKRFLEEPLPPDSGPSAGSVVELDPMLDEYYTARGWDVRTGIPSDYKLKELNLK
jgi:aldehyde:ferredoxin oxidoreductase